jgi:hypothetical protein
MFLLPYVKLSDQQVWLFLERNGTHLIEIDVSGEEAVEHATEFAELNGFTLASEVYLRDDIVFCPIKPSCAALAECYSWKETPPGTMPPREVWRTFIWISSLDRPDPWGVNAALGGISLSDSAHTAYSVLKTILDLKA